MLHMPLEVIGQHAQKHMTANPIIVFIINGANFQLHCFQITESALDKGQTFIRVDHFQGIHMSFIDIGANDIAPIKAFLLGDVSGIDRPE